MRTAIEVIILKGEMAKETTGSGCKNGWEKAEHYVSKRQMR